MKCGVNNRVHALNAAFAEATVLAEKARVDASDADVLIAASAVAALFGRRTSVR